MADYIRAADLRREVQNIKNEMDGMALIGAVPLWQSFTSRLDGLIEVLDADEPTITDADVERAARAHADFAARDYEIPCADWDNMTQESKDMALACMRAALSSLHAKGE